MGMVLSPLRTYFYKTSHGTFRNPASARKVSLLPFTASRSPAPVEAGKTLPALERASSHHLVVVRPLTPIQEAEEPATYVPARSSSPPTPTLTTDSGDSLDSPFLSTPIPTPEPIFPHIQQKGEDTHAAHDYLDAADDSLEGILGAPSLFSPTFISPAPSTIPPTPDLPFLPINAAKYDQVAHLEAPRVEHNQGLIDFAHLEELAEDEAILAECIPYAALSYADVYAQAVLSPLELLAAQVGAGSGGAALANLPRAVADYPLPPPSHAPWTANKVDCCPNAACAHLLEHLATFPSTGSDAGARFARRLSSLPASPASSALSDLWGTPYEVALFGAPNATLVTHEGAFPAFCLGPAELFPATTPPYTISSLLSPSSGGEARVNSPDETFFSTQSPPSPLPLQCFPNNADTRAASPLIAPRPQRPDGWMPIAQWEELAEEATYPFLDDDPSPPKEEHSPRDLALVFPSPLTTPACASPLSSYCSTPPLSVRVSSGSAVKLGATVEAGDEACELAWPDGQGFDFRWTYGMV
ncbi:hypothetical protein JCM10450v2_003542 [Rhodotorula kratochvilovae]